MPNFTFVFSAMGGTKTRELLATDYNFKVDCELYSYVIKPSKDTRDGYNIIHSRDGGERIADLVAFPNTNIFDAVQKEMPNIVLVDEVQFLNKQHIIQLKDIKDKLDIPVIAYGLKNDFKNEMFEGTMYTFLYANVFKQLKTVCKVCKRNSATMAIRLIDGIPVFEGEQIKVGGNESYLSACSKCYDNCKDKRCIPNDNQQRGNG